MKITVKTLEDVIVTNSFESAISCMFENRKANKPAVIIMMK